MAEIGLRISSARGVADTPVLSPPENASSLLAGATEGSQTLQVRSDPAADAVRGHLSVLRISADEKGGYKQFEHGPEDRAHPGYEGKMVGMRLRGIFGGQQGKDPALTGSLIKQDRRCFCEL